jgi:hypothetical protein
MIQVVVIFITRSGVIFQLTSGAPTSTRVTIWGLLLSFADIHHHFNMFYVLTGMFILIFDFIRLKADLP